MKVVVVVVAIVVVDVGQIKAVIRKKCRVSCFTKL